VNNSELIRFVRFLLTSGFAALINVGARVLLSTVFAYETSVAIAYLAGMVTAFVLGRFFVFEHGDDGMHGQFARFALVNAVGFAQVWLVSVGLARLVFPAIGVNWQADTLAHLAGVASPVVTSYLMHKHFSFRNA